MKSKSSTLVSPAGHYCANIAKKWLIYAVFMRYQQKEQDSRLYQIESLKMERFLEKNEGLRNRIAFHVDFPDYNAEELCDILKLMSKEKGYMLDEEAEKKCRVIFDCACKNAEFGNGRFVRNVLE